VSLDVISIVISGFALLASIGSLIVSGHVARRDRARLRAKSTFQEFVNAPARIEVEAVNVGRRPVILTRMVLHYGDVSSTTTRLGEDRTGLRLQEHEKFSENITADPTMLIEPNSLTNLTDLRFEDTLGRQYRVKHVKKHLKRLFKDSNERNL
jgi:hypothetical protein